MTKRINPLVELGNLLSWIEKHKCAKNNRIDQRSYFRDNAIEMGYGRMEEEEEEEDKGSREEEEGKLNRSAAPKIKLGW